MRALLSRAPRRAPAPLSPVLTLSPAVAAALRAGAPVVALESTIVAHGMPFPANLETARAVEADVRAGGATPATVALAGGRLHVGASDALLEALARGGGAVRKASRRDVASVLAGGGLGATTVAATMLAAAAAGVRVFATGGVGGVHRGGESSMDVSADLAELGRTRVCVVCAGVKSLLDIPRTLEVLESHGVPVWALGADDFPAFYSPRSGARAPERVDSTAAAARMLAAADALGLANGELLAVPNPAPVDGGADVEAAIAEALAAAERAGIAGAAATPFLLRRVAEKTGGASLRANIALVRNNARVAAALACDYAALGAPKHARGARLGRLGGSRRAFSTSAPPPPPRATWPASGIARDGGVIFFGGAVLDTLARAGAAYTAGASNPGAVTQTPGGVARNVAEVVARLAASDGAPLPVHLVTALGGDAAGAALRAACAAAGVAVHARAPAPGARSATYVALLDARGELVGAVADMAALDALAPRDVADAAALLRGARLVVADANVPPPALAALAAAAAAARVPLVFEPISVAKAPRVVAARALGACALIKPNRLEVFAVADALRAQLGLPPLPAVEGRDSGAAGGAAAEAAGGAEARLDGADAGDDDDDGLPAALDYRTLAAAQTVLGGMLRDDAPVSAAALDLAWRGLDAPGGAAAVAGCAPAALAAAAAARAGGGGGGGVSGGALIGGRKHVLVSLGADGVLWLSARALTREGADLMLTLPFFAAARHAAVDFDFVLVPPPPAVVRKVTGAGDALLGGALWALAARGDGVAAALRWGLAAAAEALEHEPSEGAGGAVAAGLTRAAVEARLHAVADVDAEVDA